MAKLVNRVPKYRHHRATGQAVVTLSGHDHYLGPWQSAKSRREYAWLTSEWLAAGGVVAKDQSPAIADEELRAAFWQHAKAYYVNAEGRPTTEQRNFRTLIKRFRRAYGEMRACNFGPLKLKAFRQSLIDEGLATGNELMPIRALASVEK